MKNSGYTLIETVFTLVLLAGLALFSISSSSWLVERNEQQIIMDEMRTAIQYAKIQAISLGHPVYLTPLDSAFNWSKGMILTKMNKNTNELEPLYQWQWDHRRWSLSWQGVYSANKITLSNNPINAISNGKFILSNLRTQQKVEIILNRLGRLRVIKPVV